MSFLESDHLRPESIRDNENSGKPELQVLMFRHVHYKLGRDVTCVESLLRPLALSSLTLPSPYPQGGINSHASAEAMCSSADNSPASCSRAYSNLHTLQLSGLERCYRGTLSSALHEECVKTRNYAYVHQASDACYHVTFKRPLPSRSVLSRKHECPARREPTARTCTYFARVYDDRVFKTDSCSWNQRIIWGGGKVYEFHLVVAHRWALLSQGQKSDLDGGEAPGLSGLAAIQPPQARRLAAIQPPQARRLAAIQPPQARCLTAIQPPQARCLAAIQPPQARCLAAPAPSGQVPRRYPAPSGPVPRRHPAPSGQVPRRHPAPSGPGASPPSSPLRPGASPPSSPLRPGASPHPAPQARRSRYRPIRPGVMPSIEPPHARLLAAIHRVASGIRQLAGIIWPEFVGSFTGPIPARTFRTTCLSSMGTGFDSGRAHLRISACGNRAGRCHWSTDFLGDLPFPPTFHSGAAPYSPRFTLIGSQDLDVKSRPNLFTHSPQLTVAPTSVCLSRLIFCRPDVVSRWLLEEGLGKESAMAFVRDPSQHLHGGIWKNHGKPKSRWPDRESNPRPPECESRDLGGYYQRGLESRRGLSEVGMDEFQNARAGKTGDLRENPPTSGIVRQDPQMRKLAGIMDSSRRPFCWKRRAKQTALQRCVNNSHKCSKCPPSAARHRPKTDYTFCQSSEADTAIVLRFTPGVPFIFFFIPPLFRTVASSGHSAVYTVQRLLLSTGMSKISWQRQSLEPGHNNIRPMSIPLKSPKLLHNTKCGFRLLKLLTGAINSPQTSDERPEVKCHWRNVSASCHNTFLRVFWHRTNSVEHPIFQRSPQEKIEVCEVRRVNWPSYNTATT
ncbi:hypothetical protein PR048_020649 [Dryococelus australis]|uniref:Uncharacterized protein n=1 Tax=Dryococelus australis TaxID=614101 RepID=A0ABQ9H6X4_9NEOP|nr:hypothetical protein PR048_020649 [Dryococelus australis]